MNLTLWPVLVKTPLIWMEGFLIQGCVQVAGLKQNRNSNCSPYACQYVMDAGGDRKAVVVAPNLPVTVASLCCTVTTQGLLDPKRPDLDGNK